MKTYTQEELDLILAKHNHWLLDEEGERADLSYSNLRGSNLSGSNLSYSNLSGSDLRGSDLRDVKEDFFLVLAEAKTEVDGLYKALMDGRINGASYEGECACLVGTIAKVRNTNYKELQGLAPNVNRQSERWFLGINKGDTPDNSQISSITVEWLKEFAKKNEITLSTREVIWSTK